MVTTFDIIKPHHVVNATMPTEAPLEQELLPEAILSASYVYESNQEIQQQWNVGFVVFAYLLACVSAYSAVHLMDHALWRAEELKKASIIKYPDVYAAVMLGFGAVWSMHL